MPLFEYQCAEGHSKVEYEKYEASGDRVCKECGKPAFRVMSTASFRLYGEGFYKQSQREK